MSLSPSEKEQYVNDMQAAAESFLPDRYTVDYLAYHRKRFLATLDFLPPPSNQEARLLELGAFMPFSYALTHRSGYSEVRLGDMPPWAKGDKGVIKVNTSEPMELSMEFFDFERDEYPYPADYFDTILFLEDIEHLTIDPMFALQQIHRCCKPGGHLVVSTPNLISTPRIKPFIRGDNPTTNYLYPRTDNLFSRHNREYTPSELGEIIQAAGFTVEQLLTLDIWHVPSLGEKLLRRLLPSSELRGDCTLAVARKTAAQICDRYPPAIYLPG